MASIPPDAVVTLDAGAAGAFRYPPTGEGRIAVAVHAASLKVPHIKLTTVAEFANGGISWVASIDEDLLAQNGEHRPDARRDVASRLLQGPQLWNVIRPGLLRHPGSDLPDTVYKGDRPWVVLGGPVDCGVIAAPLNDLGYGKLRPYQCAILAKDLAFQGSKDSKIEFNHIWAFPSATPQIGQLSLAGRGQVEYKVRQEFDL